MTDKDNFKEINEMKLLSQNPFDFDVDITEIAEKGLAEKSRLKNIKDYIIFAVLSISILGLMAAVSIINIKLMMILEIIISSIIPLSVIPITIYKIRRAELEN